MQKWCKHFFFFTLLLTLPFGAFADGSAAEAVSALADKLVSRMEQDTGTTGEPLILAVLPFQNQSENAEKNKIGEAATELLITSLSQEETLKLVERTQIEKLLEEQRLSLSGMLDSDKAPEIGEMLNAEYLILGAVTEMGSNYFINAQITAVETSEILAAVSVETRIDAMVELAEDMFPERKYPSSAMFRSLMVPSWGQFYNDQPGKGALFLGTEMAALASFGVFYYLGHNHYQDYLEPSATTVASYDSASTFFTIASISVCTAAAVHIWGAVDAWLSARKRNATTSKTSVY